MIHHELDVLFSIIIIRYDYDRMSLDLDLDQYNDHNIELDDVEMTGNNPNQAEKRAHHNALERKRRDHIKESFNDLRDVIPSLKGEKVNENPLVIHRSFSSI